MSKPKNDAAGTTDPSKAEDLTTTGASKGISEADLARFASAELGGPEDNETVDLDVIRINDLIKKASQRGGVRMLDLVHQLEREDGLHAFKADDGHGKRHMVEMAGVRARAVEDISRTLDNWCNAARRTVLQAG